MLQFKTYTCVKCGKNFTKAVGGIVTSPEEMVLNVHPVCNKCKLSKIADITGRKK